MWTSISVIVPTLNRCGDLEEALSSVRAQSSPGAEYEIIVVDNGSRDGTRGLIGRMNRDGNRPVRYVWEPRAGLHWARHKGVRVARGEILAFTDDDAVVSEHWLAGLRTAYQDPQLGAAGGPIHVRWRTPPPVWVPPLGSFGFLDYGRDYQELCWPRTINGGNFSVRKQALFEVGGFNPDTSVEDRLVGDGEVGLCRKLYAAGWKIAYVPSALVYHVQDGATLTLCQMRHRYAQLGRFHVYVDYKSHRWGILQLLRCFVGMLGQAADRKLRALTHWPTRDPAYYRHEVNAAASLASAGYYLRLAFGKNFRQIVLRDDWLHDA